MNRSACWLVIIIVKPLYRPMSSKIPPSDELVGAAGAAAGADTPKNLAAQALDMTDRSYGAVIPPWYCTPTAPAGISHDQRQRPQRRGARYRGRAGADRPSRRRRH